MKVWEAYCRSGGIGRSRRRVKEVGVAVVEEVVAYDKVTGKERRWQRTLQVELEEFRLISDELINSY
jgi:hypothetical protein